jgi:hypothetical protein
MLAAAVALAFTYWGVPPCPVHVAPLEANVLGETRYLNGECGEIVIRPGPWRWNRLCSTVLHEAGHAAGLPHSEDQRSPMFGELIRTADACKGRRPAQYRPGAVIRL